MTFLPIERALYLRVQFVLNLILTTHLNVRHTMLLYADQLVWSSLSRSATQQLHRLVVAQMLGATVTERSGYQYFDISRVPDEVGQSMPAVCPCAERWWRFVAANCGRRRMIF